MLWINHSWSVSHATPRKPIASVTRHRAPSRTHRAPSPTIAPHRAITSQSQQPIIHATISTCVYAFIHLFFILKTHQTREIQHNYSHHIYCHYLLINHPSRTITSVTRHYAITSHPIAPHRTPSHPIANPSTMSSFQHAPMHSFILLSFFKHIKREKFNHNIFNTLYAIIIYW